MRGPAPVGRRVLRRSGVPAPDELLLTVPRAVWALAAAGAVSWGLLYYSFGVLLGPMTVALRASPAEVSAAFTIALVAAAGVAPAIGRAVDRFGAGPVMAVGSLLGALGFGMVGLASSTAGLYAAWAVLGVAHAATSYEPAFAAVTAWFPEDAPRRRALLVVTSVGGLASPLFVPFTALVVAAMGVRSGAWVFAAVLALLVTPLHAAVARAPAAPRVAGPAVRTPLALAAVVAIQAYACTTLAAFVVPALVDRGMDALHAAGLGGLVGAAQVPARFVYAPLCRWVSAKARLSMLLVAQAVALGSVGVLSGPLLAAALVMFGAANGLVTLERASVVAERFGVSGYGARTGALAAGATLARAAAPLSVALFAGRASYPCAFALVACALLAGAALHASTERRRQDPGPTCEPDAGMS